MQVEKYAAYYFARKCFCMTLVQSPLEYKVYSL